MDRVILILMGTLLMQTIAQAISEPVLKLEAFTIASPLHGVHISAALFFQLMVLLLVAFSFSALSFVRLTKILGWMKEHEFDFVAKHAQEEREEVSAQRAA